MFVFLSLGSRARQIPGLAGQRPHMLSKLQARFVFSTSQSSSSWGFRGALWSLKILPLFVWLSVLSSALISFVGSSWSPLYRGVSRPTPWTFLVSKFIPKLHCMKPTDMIYLLTQCPPLTTLHPSGSIPKAEPLTVPLLSPCPCSCFSFYSLSPSQTLISLFL